MSCFLFLNISGIHHDDYVIEDSELPDYLIKKCNGLLILNQTAPSVTPIRNFSDYRLIENSGRICNHHNTYFQRENRIMQVRLI
jgi:hypothetical protein